MNVSNASISNAKRATTMGLGWKVMLFLWAVTAALNVFSILSTSSMPASTGDEILLRWNNGNSAIYGLAACFLGIVVCVSAYKEGSLWGWLAMWCYPAIWFFMALNVSLTAQAPLPDYGAFTLGIVSTVVLLLQIKTLRKNRLK